MADRSIQRKPSSAHVYGILIDGIIRYIGKGRGSRSKSHINVAIRINRLREAGERVRTSRFYNELAAAIRRGRQVSVTTIADGMSDDEAYRRELQEIAAAPAGQLWNVLRGGLGGDPTFFAQFWERPGTRERAGAKQRAVWDRPGYRESQRRIQKISCGTPEFRARRSSEMTARLQRDEYRRLHSERLRLRWKRDRETILKYLQRGKELARAKFSEATRRKWQDPEWRAKLCTAQKARWTLEERAARSRLMKAKFADPQYVANHKRRCVEAKQKKNATNRSPKRRVVHSAEAE